MNNTKPMIPPMTPPVILGIQARRPSPPISPPPLSPMPSPLSRANHPPALVFAPLAWLKLKLFLHAQDVEVGGFGVSSEGDLLYIEDFVTVKQTVSTASVQFDDAAVADYFDDCADQGIAPNRCGRVWLHTHPAISPLPSSTDEMTFRRAFGSCDWAVMAIVARGGEKYARLRFNAGPGGEVPIPLEVDWERYPEALADYEGQLDDLFGSWMNEYGLNIHEEMWLTGPTPALQAAASGVAQLPADSEPCGHREGFDGLDELYDQRMAEAGWGFTGYEEMYA